VPAEDENHWQGFVGLESGFAMCIFDRQELSLPKQEVWDHESRYAEMEVTCLEVMLCLTVDVQSAVAETVWSNLVTFVYLSTKSHVQVDANACRLD